MKKRFLLFVALFSLMLTGCFEKQPMEVLSETIKVSKDVKSVEMTATVVAKVEEDGVNVDFNLPVTVAVNTSDDLSLKLSVGENMFTSPFDAYVNVKEKELNAYLPVYLLDAFYLPEYEITWNHKWVNVNEEVETVEGIDLDKLQNLDIAKVVTEENFVYVDEEGDIKHYELILNDALLERLATELGETYEEEDKLGTELKMDVYINVDTYQMTKLVIDMKDMISDLAESNENTEDEMFDMDSIKELSFTMEFKNYNNTNVTIPEDVYNDYMTMDQYINGMIGNE